MWIEWRESWRLTLGAGLYVFPLNDVEIVVQLSYHTAIFLVHQHDVPAGMFAATSTSYITLTRRILLRVVGLVLLCVARCTGSLQKCRTLSEDGLKRIDIFLTDAIRSGPNLGKFDTGEGARLRTQIPTRYEVAARWLVVDLCGCWERDVEFGREVEMKVEVFFGGCGRGGLVIKGRGSGNHQ